MLQELVMPASRCGIYKVQLPVCTKCGDTRKMIPHANMYVACTLHPPLKQEYSLLYRVCDF